MMASNKAIGVGGEYIGNTPHVELSTKPHSEEE